MRIRSLNMISLVVVMVSCGLVRAVPSVHEAVRASLRRDATERGFLPLAERRPNDEAAWLTACRAIPGTGKARTASLDRAYARAIVLAPTSAAPHWFYAIQLMHDIPFERDEQDVVYPRYPRGSHRSTQLNIEQKAAAGKADLALRRAGQLDPQNAAVDYFGAYLALADRKDAAAMALLRSGLGKQRWNEYGRAAAVATLETLRPVLPVAAASTYAANSASNGWASTMEWDLARVLAGMSILAARQHDDDRAIFLRESADHLGRLMIRNAYQVLDAETGVIVWAFGGAWDPRQPVPSVARDPTDATSQLYPGAAVAVYLRQHGRAALAREYESFGKQLRPIGIKLDRVKDLRRKQGARERDLATILGHLSLAEIPTLGLLLLSGMTALLLRVFRRPVRPIEWSLWGWLFVVSACLALVFVVGLIWPGESAFLKSSREMAAQMGLNTRDVRPSLGDRPWGYYFAVVGLPAILVSTWIAVLVHRRRHRDVKVRPVGHYLGTLLCLLLLLAAVLSLAVFAVGVPAAQETRRHARTEQAVIYRGEIAYYGLRLP